jgi:hypothetical protein
MSEPVIKEVRVKGSEYSHEAKSFIFLVECPDKRFYTQVPIQRFLPNITNINDFTESQMKTATSSFCKEIIGKKIKVVFDVDLDEKLKDRYPLNYV